MNAPKLAKIALIDNHSYSRLAAIDILQLDHYTVVEAEAAKGWRNLELVAQFIQYLTQAQATFATTSG